MNNISRVFATGFIWAAMTIVGVSIMVTRATSDGGALAFMMTVLIIGATFGTSAVWKSGDSDRAVREQSEKSKRRSRVERLMNDLSESDLDELRYRLMSGHDDDDPVTLEELIHNDKRR